MLVYKTGIVGPTETKVISFQTTRLYLPEGVVSNRGLDMLKCSAVSTGL